MATTDMVLRWVISPAARRAITGHVRSREQAQRGQFSRSEARDIVRSAWIAYDEAVPGLPEQPTAGSGLVLRSACFSLMLLRELLRRGVERAEALDTIAATSWRLFRPSVRLSSTLARRHGTGPDARLRSTVRDAHQFPFNDPGWRYEPRGVNGYDIVHCPLAAYLLDEDAADLCVAAFCDLDFKAAELRGLRLDRSGTRAEGRPVCDFRYKLSSPGGR